jgi:4-hydroxybenzoate polyprenyltransferase
MTGAQTLIGDIPVNGWIDRLAPAFARPYLRLMRLDRPIGTWLLLFPGWWSIALASDGLPDWRLFLIFAVGAVVMRGAGCTFNDITDRDFDGLVERTRARPIPSGAVSLKQAWLFLGLELLIGFLILLYLPPFAIWVGAASLFLVFTYPFMKRITYWPQAWLGLTFNWGALLGYAAVKSEIGLPAIALYAAGLFWTLGYDTIYAHQDREDDALIGVKSTALRLGRQTQAWLFVFYGLTLGLMGLSGYLAALAWPFYFFLALAGLHFLWQALRVDIDNAPDCLAKFKANRFIGWLILAGYISGRIF